MENNEGKAEEDLDRGYDPNEDLKAEAEEEKL